MEIQPKLLRLLQEREYAVRVMSLLPIDQLKGDAAIMAEQWTGETLSPDDTRPIQSDQLIVDALFGAGFNRPVDGVGAGV